MKSYYSSKFNLLIKTDVFYSEAGFEEGSVYIQLLETSKYVQVEARSEIYIAPKEFDKQLILTRDGFHLVYGRKKRAWPYFLIIRGNKTILACPLQSIKDIIINFIVE